MLSTQLLREQLDRYADGALSVEAFEEWLASESWDMGRAGVPRGLQRLIEALQVALINYSDRKVSLNELRDELLKRRAQLHKAREVTQSIERAHAMLADAMEQARHQQESIAGSEGIIVQASVQASAA